MELIAAVDENWALGLGGEQLIYLPGDLKNFKRLTLGHGVLLGHRTLATFPGGRPLPGRENYILSRSAGLAVEGARVLHSVEQALAECREDTFVIGGGSVYRQMLPWCTRAYVTRLEGTWQADTWLPDLDADPAWRLSGRSERMEEKGTGFFYTIYERVADDVS